MSGLSRTPGKRVWVNSPPRVRIPPSPPDVCRPSILHFDKTRNAFALRVFYFLAMGFPVFIGSILVLEWMQWY